MDGAAADLSIEEVAARSGVPARTVRYYVAKGLLPGPGGRGKAAAYGEEHLLRLRLIRLLAARRLPLDEIGARLAGLTTADVRALLAEEERGAAELRRAEGSPSPREYVAALLRRARQQGGEGIAEPAASWLPPAAPLPSPPATARESAPPAGPPEPPAAPLPSPPARRQPTPPADPATEAQPWRRWELAPGLELHVRADAEERQRALVAGLLALARAALGR